MGKDGSALMTVELYKVDGDTGELDLITIEGNHWSVSILWNADSPRIPF